MEQYMGYDASSKAKASTDERELPVYRIEGTDFYVDIKKHELRQVDNKYNRMTLGDIKEEYGFSFFYYDTKTKNLYTGSTTVLPSHVSIIFVPCLKELDPVGLARRHGFPDDYYTRGRSYTLNEQLPQLSLKGQQQQGPDREEPLKRSVKR